MICTSQPNRATCAGTFKPTWRNTQRNQNLILLGSSFRWLSSHNFLLLIYFHTEKKNFYHRTGLSAIKRSFYYAAADENMLAQFEENFVRSSFSQMWLDE